MKIITYNPYIIAEASINHNGNISVALEMVLTAKNIGTDCIKFQAYTASELAVKNAEKAEYQKNKIKSETQYDMLLRYELGEKDIKYIKNYCDSINIDFMATPFSVRWVNILYDVGMKVFKIGSANLKMDNLLKTIGNTKLPVILSTGMSDLEDVNYAVNILREEGCKQLSLMHCVSLYPTEIEQVNLFSMCVLKNKFNLPVGFSDHTTDIYMGGLAVASGATILEKHFTLDNSMEGPDHKVSLSPDNLKRYIKYARKVAVICGREEKKPLKEELIVKKAVYASLVAKQFIKKGDKIVESMLTEKRPATGICPTQIKKIIGRFVNKNIQIDDVIFWRDIV